MIYMAKSGKNNQKKKAAPTSPVQEKVVVKKKSGCLLPLLILVVLIVLVIWLLSHFNIGFFGKDDSSGKNSSNTSSDSVSSDNNDEKKTEDETGTIPEISDRGEKIVDITVTGTQYRYDNGYIDIEDFISELKSMSGSICVRITDENAYNDVMHELKEALVQEGIPFTESSAN